MIVRKHGLRLPRICGHHGYEENGGTRKKRKFTPEYRAEVVKLIETGGKSVGEVARELDLTETSVRQWKEQAEMGS